ncbi:hypothetical protein AJ80_09264 [Polytolypa hystricis UAMH7299]|uniref:Ubiquitin carboxyl-terminal hydrolase 19 n=1 Tax=Polytolypa hystricis (strain UAMH7299) TaxID=1447883 RepID=A0A2B7WTI7_POLH7|nr:hypothetical protein AJ80_09264 [Polytolypa hystricis UAMH7299]
MDAQYPFASREDIWRVHEEVKDLYTTQLEHGERITRLERRREDDARMKSVWGPLSPFPLTMSSTVSQEPSYTPTTPFGGFDQAHHQGLGTNLNLETEEEPRRGASRANSVRFDESSMYYGQTNRSTSELPLRTGSGLGSHPLTERSLSHRSDGKQSSSGQSHHSARTNSMGLDAARMVGGTNGVLSNTTIPPPPGLFILGPVPCIIRCWLTTNFSNDSLLYAAVCSGSYRSIIGSEMVRKLGLEEEVTAEDDGGKTIKLPMYLPEASIYQPTSRASSPVPQLPALTITFLIRHTDPNDKTIQILLGSDVLRAHNADILFSQDKMLVVDNERNKISIPLVRPEDVATFSSLTTGSAHTIAAHGENASLRDAEHDEHTAVTNGQREAPEPIGHHRVMSPVKPEKTTLSLRTSSDSFDSRDTKTRSSTMLTEDSEDTNASSTEQRQPKSVISERSTTTTAKSETGGPSVWTNWRRESTTTATPTTITGATTATTPSTNKSVGSAGEAASATPYLSAFQRSNRVRNMKILKPMKPSTSTPSSSFRGPSSSSGSTTSTPASAVESVPPTRFADAFGSHRPTQSSGSGGGEVSSASHHESAYHHQHAMSAHPGNAKAGDNAGVSPWTGTVPGKARSANPIGGASAFGWLNSAQQKQGGSTGPSD